MDTVTISSKYQMVIPRAIREKWNVKPGQKVLLMIIGNRLEVVPVRDIKEARGFLKGMSSVILNAMRTTVYKCGRFFRLVGIF